MKFDPWKCPECGDPADAVLESVEAFARLGDPSAAGELEYGDYTEVCWDTQKMEIDEQGRVCLRCPEGHTWSARVDGDEVDVHATVTNPPDVYRHLLDTAQECLREFIEERADSDELARMVSLFADRDHAISVDESLAYFRGEPVEDRAARKDVVPSESGPERSLHQALYLKVVLDTDDPSAAGRVERQLESIADHIQKVTGDPVLAINCVDPSEIDS